MVVVFLVVPVVALELEFADVVVGVFGFVLTTGFVDVAGFEVVTGFVLVTGFVVVAGLVFVLVVFVLGLVAVLVAAVLGFVGAVVVFGAFALFTDPVVATGVGAGVSLLVVL
mgnify:CR=1 FL=1